MMWEGERKGESEKKGERVERGRFASLDLGDGRPCLTLLFHVLGTVSYYHGPLC